jgi:DNA-directed RNA polymerase subunit L
MDIDVSLPESVAPIVADTRYAAIDVRFQNEGHTLGNLLESYIGYEHMTGVAEPHVSYVAYNVPHPLRPEMFVRVAINTTTDIEAMKLQALAVVANTCRTLKRICSQAGAEWDAMFVVNPAPVA